MAVDVFTIVFLVVPAVIMAAVVFFGKATWMPYAVLLLTVGLAIAAFM